MKTMPHLRRRHALAAGCALLTLPLAGWGQGSRAELPIGQSAPLSGPMAGPMANVLAGQALAFDDINRRGGINGRQVKLIQLDDGFDPKRTLDNARELIDTHGVLALFGPVGTAQTAALLPLVAEKRVPLIAAYSGSPSLRMQPNPYFFTTQASYIEELQRMVRNLVTILAKRIAVVYQNNEFGKGLLPIAEKIIASEGGSFAGSRALDPNGADAVASAQAVAQMQPQAVIMIVAGPAVAAYVKAHRAYVAAPIYTFSLSIGSAILKALGDDGRGIALSRATPYPWRTTTALARDFNLLMAKAGKDVDYDHFLGYINARVMIEALKAAGRNPTPESVKTAMEGFTRLDLGGYVLSYGPNNHHGSNFVEITVVGPRGNFIR
jgi:ABC-type branched-subunit amino acid transport system substrate-binding protein